MHRRRATAWLWEKGSKTTHHPGTRRLHKAHGTSEGSELVWGTVEYQVGSNCFLQLVSERDGRTVVSQIQWREAVSQLGRNGTRGRVACYPSPFHLRKAGTGQSRKLIASFKPPTVRNGGLDLGGLVLRGSAYVEYSGSARLLDVRVELGVGDTAMVVAGVREERRTTEGE